MDICHKMCAQFSTRLKELIPIPDLHTEVNNPETHLFFSKVTGCGLTESIDRQVEAYNGGSW